MARYSRALEQLTACLKAQDLKIQKMSDQLAATGIRLVRVVNNF